MSVLRRFFVLVFILTLHLSAFAQSEYFDPGVSGFAFGVGFAWADEYGGYGLQAGLYSGRGFDFAIAVSEVKDFGSTSLAIGIMPKWKEAGGALKGKILTGVQFNDAFTSFLMGLSIHARSPREKQIRMIPGFTVFFPFSFNIPDGSKNFLPVVGFALAFQSGDSGSKVSFIFEPSIGYQVDQDYLAGGASVGLTFPSR